MEHTYRKVILLGCILLGALSACNKALDLKPETEYSSTNYWTEPAQATAALYGAYNRLQNTLGHEYISYGEGRTDNLALNIANGPTPIALTSNTLNPNLTESRWGQFYAVIKQANLLLTNLPIMKGKGLYVGQDADYKAIIGQAYGLRALCYFYMVRIWGGVPLVTQPVADGTEDLRIPRSDSTTIYKQVKLDLDSAYVYLPSTYSTPAKTRANITRGAIDALYTDYYMQKHDFENAIIAANRVIDNTNFKLVALYDATANYLANPTLIDNAEYTKMFTEGFSGESIFEIAFSFSEGTSSQIAFLYGSGGQYKPSTPVRSIFEATDLRALVCFNTARNNVMKNFEKIGFNANTQNDKNIIIYRLADILLLKAEALNYQGKRDEAFALVNRIRQRAGAAAISPTAYLNYTQTQADDFIFDERNREMCFEGKRWFDLVRTGRVIKVMKPVNGLSSPDNILWPVSLETMRVNSLIEQNSFYK